MFSEIINELTNKKDSEIALSLMENRKEIIQNQIEGRLKDLTKRTQEKLSIMKELLDGYFSSIDERKITEIKNDHHVNSDECTKLKIRRIDQKCSEIRTVIGEKERFFGILKGEIDNTNLRFKEKLVIVNGINERTLEKCEEVEELVGKKFSVKKKLDDFERYFDKTEAQKLTIDNLIKVKEWNIDEIRGENGKKNFIIQSMEDVEVETNKEYIERISLLDQMKKMNGQLYEHSSNLETSIVIKKIISDLLQQSFEIINALVAEQNVDGINSLNLVTTEYDQIGKELKLKSIVYDKLLETVRRIDETTKTNEVIARELIREQKEETNKEKESQNELNKMKEENVNKFSRLTTLKDWSLGEWNEVRLLEEQLTNIRLETEKISQVLQEKNDEFGGRERKMVEKKETLAMLDDQNDILTKEIEENKRKIKETNEKNVLMMNHHQKEMMNKRKENMERRNKFYLENLKLLELMDGLENTVDEYESKKKDVNKDETFKSEQQNNDQVKQIDKIDSNEENKTIEVGEIRKKRNNSRNHVTHRKDGNEKKIKKWKKFGITVDELFD
ncbi:hypothetical protein SNEBB_010612 [Seison nebaliae]|nr:hypothetical protein SNEBB_010612 [Seison nebaliae]